MDEGKGTIFLFLHGSPTSSYLWLNIIPFVSKENLAIAVDSIALGKSGKPDIFYKMSDHCSYIKELKMIAKEMGQDSELALLLFDSEIYKGRLLCSKMFKPKDIPKPLIEKWVPAQDMSKGIWKVFYRNVFLGFYNENNIGDKQVSIRLSQNMV